MGVVITKDCTICVKAVGASWEQRWSIHVQCRSQCPSGLTVIVSIPCSNWGEGLGLQNVQSQITKIGS